MLRTYFDASVKQNQPLVAVAGYIATVNQWEKFECDWRLTLAHHNAPYMHMREICSQSKKSPFAKWGENKRATFLKDMSDVINSNLLHSFGAAVSVDDYNEASKLYNIYGMAGYAYSLCARACAAQVQKWQKREGYQSPVEYVFDEEDIGAQELLSVFKRDRLPTPIFKPSRDRKNGAKGLTPLQAADFAAWETARFIRDVARKQIRTRAEIRPSFITLNSLSNSWCMLRKEELLRMCAKYFSQMD